MTTFADVYLGYVKCTASFLCSVVGLMLLNVFVISNNDINEPVVAC